MAPNSTKAKLSIASFAVFTTLYVTGTILPTPVDVGVVPGVEIVAPPSVSSLLRRSCYDCHSDATQWPWYSKLPPFSSLIAKDVVEGRRKLNFSRWGAYPDAEKRKLLKWCGREMELSDMPLPLYIPLHPGAALSDDDRRFLLSWFEDEAEEHLGMGAL